MYPKDQSYELYRQMPSIDPFATKKNYCCYNSIILQDQESKNNSSFNLNNEINQSRVFKTHHSPLDIIKDLSENITGNNKFFN